MKLFFPLLRLAEGWVNQVLMEIDDDGMITSIERGSRAGDAQVINGPVVAGMPNTHSHAFQRLMAGLTEWRAGKHDSFWSWRELMYRYAGQLNPQIMRSVATLLYIEMLKAGYTSVCEFHYVHHDANGDSYTPASRMSDELIAAAHDSGIQMTLLPALYMHGGFSAAPLNATQRRFYHSLDTFRQLVTDLKRHESPMLRIGGACHSLRAVSPEHIAELGAFLQAWPTPTPFHLHIAEQQAEVQEAVTHLGQRPVDYLLDHVSLNRHSALVHATHITEEECERLAQSPACVSLCPTTEANLGDGIFPLRDFLAQAGCFCIGSDSQVTVSVIGELRLLEYGQRLSYQQRNVATSDKNPHCGDFLWNHAVTTGALASGQRHGGLQEGGVASFIVLNTDLVPEHITQPGQILDALVFAGATSWIHDVYVAGKCVVSGGHHAGEFDARYQYSRAIGQLREMT